MLTPVERVQTWREQKRREGYLPLTVWLKPEVKHQIEDLAAARHEDLGQVITVALGAFAAAQPVDRTLNRTVRQLVREALADLVPPLSPPPAIPEPVPRATTLLPGEYGALVGAVRAMAAQLRRFTCPGIAHHIGVHRKKVAPTLRHLVSRGELRHQSPVYFWIDPDEKASP